MTAFRRGALTAVPFVVAVVAYVGVFLAHYDRLPDRIATHFSGGGTADDFMSRTTALWFGAGMLAGLGLLFSVLALSAKEPTQARTAVAIGAGTAATVAYPLIVTVLANADTTDPAGVRMPLWHLAVLVLAGLAAGALAWWLIGRGPRPAPAPSAPPLPLADGEAAVWSRPMTSRALLFAAAAVVVGGAVGAVFGSWWAGVLVLLLGLACVASARIRVTVDRRGLTVASTVLPRPRLALPLGRIVDAGSVQVDAMGDFGGWGYRIRPNRRGVVLRSGEALSVRTVGGREYVVTVDDSATAASLLNGLVDRHGAKGD
ncbi:DUF1648 domain-containing protein [Streptomyces sp. NPDC052114]|uniref:DUF1648 domain-containing protein n=1 Tax=unclassified Streptomyces TaxID=2593676 RepID=UPI00342433CA